MALILDGKKVQDELAVNLAREIGRLETPLTLAIIQVGDNPASTAYVKQKKLFGEKIGAVVKHYPLPSNTTESEISKLIGILNESKHHHGIILQLPLPPALSPNPLIQQIAPQKDVDGLTSTNFFSLWQNTNTGLLPATTRGVLALLDYYKIKVEGKKVTVIGRSNLVGKPIALALLNRGATVTICHSQTADLATHTKSAEIIIVATGQPKLLQAEHLSEGAGQVVVDVGISRLPETLEIKLIGDVDFDQVEPLVAAISPVPGGVGPLTVASLFANLLDAYRNL